MIADTMAYLSVLKLGQKLLPFKRYNHSKFSHIIYSCIRLQYDAMELPKQLTILKSFSQDAEQKLFFARLIKAPHLVAI